MGSIGGLFGAGGGTGGTGFTTTPGVNSGQIQNSYNQVQNLINALQAQGGLQNQSQVYNQLQQIASGQGPNPAQAMLNQTTGQNVANQAALMAGQRGASSNVGLLARQAAQQGAQIQQQAAGQGATMQAQQGLNAIGQAGQMANTMAGQQIGTTTGLYNTLQNANSAYNNVQGGLANTTLQGQQGLLGGVLGGVGGALGLFRAEGGEIPESSSGYQGESKFGAFLHNMSQNMGLPNSQSLQKGLTQLGEGIGNLKKNKIPQPVQDPNLFQGPSNQTISEMNPMASKGGNVGSKLKQGGHVPGKADISGDSLKNDTVKAMLSPGEIVIPRSVVNSKDPIKGSAEFVRAILAKKGMKHA